MNTHKNKDALAAAQIKRENLKAHVDQLVKKSGAEKDAEQVIYTHASRWVSADLSVGDPIPIIRNELKVGQLTWTVLGGVTEINEIIAASRELKSPELKRRLNDLISLKEQVTALRDRLASFDPSSLARAVQSSRGMHTELDGRLIEALGADNAAYLGLELLSVGLSDEIFHITHLIAERGPVSKGRAKEQAALSVSIAAAKFYAKIVGEKPTYGDSPDGPTGKFTPFLRDLYDSLGWTDRGLRSGLDAAVDAVGESDFQYATTGLLGGFSAYGLK